MLHKALEIAQPGDVIVASIADGYEYGYWGGLMSISAMTRGVAGLAIEGCVRDKREIIEMGFPIFCRGFSIRGTVKNTLGLINYPTVFGGIMVDPGDLILGDDDGIVIVKRNECKDVADKALKRVAEENEKIKFLKLVSQVWSTTNLVESLSSGSDGE